MRYSKDGKKEEFGEDGKLKEAFSYLLQQDEKSDLEHPAPEFLSRCNTTISILFTPK
jgi:hypothetical protein